MKSESSKQSVCYTCNDYRQEMILATLRKQLYQPDLPKEEKQRLELEIAKLEEDIGF